MTDSSAPGTLAGRGIVVTRPAEQAPRLAQLIAAAGGEALLFPTIEIVGIGDGEPLRALIERLDRFDLAIFVSPSAVAKALAAVRGQREWPARLAAAAIGAGSVAALRAHGIAEVIAPSRHFDSESLLALPALQQVAGKRIAIFRGEGGRELLAETLGARGATVEYAECYRRARPATPVTPLLDAWERNRLDAVTITSSEALDNLLAMLGDAGRSRLAQTPLFVTHQRIGSGARTRGLAHVHVTAGGDEGLVAGLIAYFTGR